MGIDIADMDNDGNLDIFTTDMLPFDPAILLKSGGEDSDKVARIKASFGFNSQMHEIIYRLIKEILLM